MTNAPIANNVVDLINDVQDPNIFIDRAANPVKIENPKDFFSGYPIKSYADAQREDEVVVRQFDVSGTIAWIVYSGGEFSWPFKAISDRCDFTSFKTSYCNVAYLKFKYYNENDNIVSYDATSIVYLDDPTVLLDNPGVYTEYTKATYLEKFGKNIVMDTTRFVGSCDYFAVDENGVPFYAYCKWAENQYGFVVNQKEHPIV